MLGLTRHDSVVGYALRFGGNAYVSMGNVLSFMRTDPFTLSAWVRLDTLHSLVLAGKSGAGTTQNGRGYLLAPQSSGAAHVALRNNSQTAVYARGTTATSLLSPRRWHHLAFTSSGSGTASGLAVYIDGAAVAFASNDDTLGTNTIVNTLAFIWGGNDDGSSGASNRLTGRSFGLAVYDKALSSGEVTTIYAGRSIADLTSVGPTSDLVGYWPVTPNDSPTGTISDHSGSAYHGTPSGFSAGDIVPVRFSELRGA